MSDSPYNHSPPLNTQNWRRSGQGLLSLTCAANFCASGTTGAGWMQGADYCQLNSMHYKILLVLLAQQLPGQHN